MSCCSNSCKLLATFCFLEHHACARAMSYCDTRIRTLHQTWPPNRPDLSFVDYRLLRVIQECVYEKQQGTSNIVDELWLLTEWHSSQGWVETPIRRGGQLCCISSEFTSVYVCWKLSKYNAIWQSYSKNKRVHFFAPQCIYYRPINADVVYCYSENELPKWKCFRGSISRLQLHTVGLTYGRLAAATFWRPSTAVTRGASMAGGMGGCIPPTFWQGDAMPLIPPLLRRICVSHHNVTFNWVWTVILAVWMVTSGGDIVALHTTPLRIDCWN